MWLGRQLASIQPTYAAAAAAMLGMCRPILGPRALCCTHRCVLAGPPVTASAWMPPRSCLASFVLHVTGSRGCIPKAAASAFGLLSARIRPPGRSNSVAKLPLPKRRGLPGVYLFSAASSTACPSALPYIPSPPPPSPQYVFPMRWLVVVVGLRGRTEQAGRLRAALFRALRRPSRMHKSPGQVVNGMQPPYQAGVGSVVSTHGASSSKASHWMGWKNVHLTA